MRRRSTTIIGAFGGNNAGDEAILSSISKLIDIADTGRDKNVISLSSNITPDAVEIYRSEFSSFSTARNIVSSAALCISRDLIIGGGQIINGSRVPLYLMFMTSCAALARVTGGRVLMIGVGTNRVHKYFLSSLFANILVRICNSVYVRDAHSKRDLLAIGCREEEISIAPDVVLSGVIGRSQIERDRVVVAIHHHPTEQHLSPKETIDLTIAVASRYPQHKIIVVAHDVRSAFDHGLLSVIASEVRGVETVALRTAEMAVELYSKAALVVSSRMHPLIIGLICGSSVVPISISEKVRDFSASYDLRSIDDSSGYGDMNLLAVENKAKIDTISKRILENRGRLVSIFRDAFGER
ncbi:MAG: polysaccharide pyruvyl transferase family protein [Phenylobacterium sp.]|uniref:polysaccharide pyruvyl transferase family protein n=1 Tax=Phenylobacterium sp. TaxID=1871053 RepID=UPI00185C7268|nr:polysaccharide pyruvyl transferase family protein [Phenylobacterium sp.]MBA4794631.1 polysaccharide pyruvyl transferase family protein [Phenylobacterium sp.]